MGDGVLCAIQAVVSLAARVVGTALDPALSAVIIGKGSGRIHPGAASI